MQPCRSKEDTAKYKREQNKLGKVGVGKDKGKGK
jgi:hypothetical protein